MALGELTKSTYQAQDRVEMLQAALSELFADKQDSDRVRFTSGLLDLAVKSHQLKQEIDSLGSSINTMTEFMNKSSVPVDKFPLISDFFDKYGTIENALGIFEKLGQEYASIRGQIDEAIKEMNPEGLQVSGWGKFASVMLSVGAAFKAVASAAAKAVIPIGKITFSVGKAMVEMNPMTKLLGALGNSLKSLYTRVKRVLVYSTIVSFFRTIKNEISGYLKQNTALMSALGQLKGSWITAFMPIYNYILPKIISLINWLTVLGQKIAMLTHRIFGGSLKASKEQAKAMYNNASAAGAATDAYEAQLAAFDELNILEEEHDEGGGAGDIDLSEPNFDYDEAALKDYLTWYDWLYDKTGKLLELHKQLDIWLQKVAEKINWLSKNVLQMFRGDNDQMAEAMLQRFRDLGRTLAEAFNHFTDAVNWNQLGQALGAGMDLAFQWLESYMTTRNWSGIGKALADVMNGIVYQIDWGNVGSLLASGWNAVWGFLGGFIRNLNWVSLGKALGDLFMRAIKSINIASMVSAISGLVLGLLQAIVSFVKQIDWFEVGQALIQKLFEAIRAIDWGQLALWLVKGLVVGIVDFIFLVVGAITQLCQELIDAFKRFWGISSPSTIMQEQGTFLVLGLLNGIQNTWSQLWAWFQTTFELFKSFIQQTWESIHTTASSLWDTITETISTKIDTFKTNAENMFTNLQTNLETTTNDLKDALINAWDLTKQGVGSALDGIKGDFSSAWSQIVSDTTSKFSDLVSKVGSAVSKIGSAVSSMLSTIASGISSAWSSISSFVSSAISRLASVKIPHFANGGVITKPTIGLMGEYSGASSNPEIVTPENLLRNIVGESNEDLATTMISMGRQIIAAIEDNATEVKIGDDVISAAAARGNLAFKKRTGRSQFAV